MNKEEKPQKIFLRQQSEEKRSLALRDLGPEF